MSEPIENLPITEERIREIVREEIAAIAAKSCLSPELIAQGQQELECVKFLRGERDTKHKPIKPSRNKGVLRVIEDRLEELYKLEKEKRNELKELIKLAKVVRKIEDENKDE